MRSVSALVVSAALLLPAHQAWACWDVAGARHGVSPALLYAIARVESDLNCSATNRSHFQVTGTYDIGCMGINSSHLARLKKRGISEADLFKPCVNIDIGAEILADLFHRRGISWDTIGAYNAACTKLSAEACRDARSRYAWHVYCYLYTNRNCPRRRSSPRVGGNAS